MPTFRRVIENHIERAVILSHGEELKVPLGELKSAQKQNDSSPTTFEQAERATIIDALKAASGQIPVAVARPNAWA